MPVIGNTKVFAFDVSPVTPSWDRRYEPEATAWAGLAVWVGERNLCAHVDEGATEIREALYVPLGPIADWFVRSHPAIAFEERAPAFPTSGDAHGSALRWAETAPRRGFTEGEWLQAREDWWQRHFLRAGTDGALLPEISFVREDEKLVVEWSRPRWDFGRRLLSEAGRAEVPWADGLHVIASFVRLVAGWLQAASNAPYPWAKLADPIVQATPHLGVALELFTGRTLDRLMELYRADDAAALAERLMLTGRGPDPAASPQAQVLRDLSPGIETPPLMDMVAELGSRVSRPDSSDTWKHSRRAALDAARAGATPEESGQFAAVELRRQLNLDGHPIKDIDKFLGDLGVEHSRSDLSTRDDRMIVGAELDGSAAVTTLDNPRTAHEWGRRFEAARGLGHILLDPVRHGALGAASGPYAQEVRRRRSGSFAAELLLPESAMERLSSGELDGAADDNRFQLLMDRYGIGAQAAAYQLWNRGWLSESDVRDDLIARFAATF
jgi:hypothetical protein